MGDDLKALSLQFLDESTHPLAERTWIAVWGLLMTT
jgi:hypothetical protein